MAAEALAEEKLADFLTVTQAAAYLGVSVRTLRGWDNTGKLKAIRHPLNDYRLYREEHLRQLLAKLRMEAQ